MAQRARDERGATGVAASVASALAVLAVLAVLASATVAGVAFRAEDPEAGPGDPTSAPPAGAPTPQPSETPSDDAAERFFPDGQVLTGDRRDNANIEIPSVDAGWTAESITIGYQSETNTDDIAAVEDPYMFERGYCEEKSGYQAARAYVGLTAPVSETTGDDRARDAAEQSVERWFRAIFDSPADYPELDYTERELSDGSPAVSTVVTFPVEDREKCDPPATELRFLAFETGEYVAVVVSNRGITRDGGDLDGGLSAEDVEAILTTARKQQEP